jgi:hypothetical protein
MRLLRIFLLIIPFCACAQDQYTVTFDEGLESVGVSACFDGTAPKRLYHSGSASLYTQSFSIGQQALKLQPGASSSRLPPMPENSCLRWRVNLAESARQSNFRLAMRVGNDLVTDADLWMWRGAAERNLHIEVKLPAGMNISAPWKQLEQRDGSVLFEPAATPATWVARVAVGNFDILPVSLNGTAARLAIIGSPSAGHQAKLLRWISQAARAVDSIYGRFPQASPQILIVPIGSRSEAVPWAHVMRGGGVGAEFFVDETRSLDEFTGDWTACHELSHMLLPFVSSQDRWLSEGLASYYQYVLLARSGVLTERQAWQGLHDGFMRGTADSNGGTLKEATLDGWNHTMRVYWSGAAMMLMADTRLRFASGGRQSLDTALAALQDCCLDSARRWRASELFRRLDRITGTRIFTDLLEAHVGDRQFPGLSETWEALGVRTRFNRVHLLDSAPQAPVRISIMGE